MKHDFEKELERFAFFLVLYYFSQEKSKFFFAGRRLSVNFLVLLINHMANLCPRNWWTCIFMCFQTKADCARNHTYRYINSWIFWAKAPCRLSVLMCVQSCTFVPLYSHTIFQMATTELKTRGDTTQTIIMRIKTNTTVTRFPRKNGVILFSYLLFTATLSILSASDLLAQRIPLPRPDRYFVEKRVSELWALSPQCSPRLGAESVTPRIFFGRGFAAVAAVVPPTRQPIEFCGRKETSFAVARTPWFFFVLPPWAGAKLKEFQSAGWVTQNHQSNL